MLRLLSYAVFFYLGYRMLKLLFGNNKQHIPSNQHKHDVYIKQQSPDVSPPHSQDGEYIEYEEIK
jgi:hypothetical protein